MLVKRFIIACDGCRRRPNVVPDFQASSEAARKQARAHKWHRIPRRDPRDSSPGQRGLDLCPQCYAVLAQERGWPDG